MNEIGLQVDAILDALVEVEAGLARLAARRVELLASATTLRLAESRPDQQGLAMRSLTAEIGCATRLSESTVIRQLNDAHTLTTSLPGTLAALSTGTISYRHAQAVVSAVTPLPHESRAGFEQTLLPTAFSTTAARFERIARRERERLHPDSIETRARAAAAERHVSITSATDGMAWLTAYLPAVLATAIDNRLTAIARAAKTSDEPRTPTQLRADAFTSLLTRTPPTPASARTSGTSDTSGTSSSGTGTSGTSHSGTSTGSTSTGSSSGTCRPGGPTPVQGTRPEIALFDTDDSPGDSTDLTTEPGFTPIPDALLAIVPTVVLTVPVLSLLGHAGGPAVVHGTGPIDIHTARRLAARAPSFVRILTDPETGETLSVGRTRYRPPPDLRLALVLDDETCRFPNCNRRAELCELDHTTDWAHGGETSRGNLHHLCAKHHHLKHDSTGWSVTARPGRELEWVTPAGRRYTTAPMHSSGRSRRQPSFVAPSGDGPSG